MITLNDDNEVGRRRWRRPARWSAAAAVAMGFAALTSAPTSALDPIPLGGSPQPIGNLSPQHPVLTFSQTITLPTPLPQVNDPRPEVCTPAAFCNEWTFHLTTASPFLVSLRNAADIGTAHDFNANDGFNLYVYDPSGQMVGSATGVGGDGQSVAIGADPSKGLTDSTPPAVGVYTVAVTTTYTEDPQITYKGEARLLSQPSWTPLPCTIASRCPLLPQMVAVPPHDFHLDGLPPAPSTPLGFPFPVTVSTGNSCYTEETVQDGAQRCLRFTTDVRNTGAGVMELRWDWVGQDSSGGPTSGLLPEGCETTQVIYSTDGSSTTRDGGPCEFHAQHAHFHYADLVTFSLHHVNADGSLGPTLANSNKASFCLGADDYFGFGTSGPANAQRDYAGLPDCDEPSVIGPSTQSVDGVMGVSPGWGDVYTWDTPGQYLDVASVPDGTYAVVEQANPAGKLLVAGTPSPCSDTVITLSGSGTTVKELGENASITCPAPGTGAASPHLAAVATGAHGDVACATCARAGGSAGRPSTAAGRTDAGGAPTTGQPAHAGASTSGASTPRSAPAVASAASGAVLSASPAASTAGHQTATWIIAGVLLLVVAVLLAARLRPWRARRPTG